MPDRVCVPRSELFERPARAKENDVLHADLNFKCRRRADEPKLTRVMRLPVWTLLLGAVSALLALPARASLPIEHWQQPSGAKVYLVRSPSIPMLDVQIDFDAGLRREPRQQVGLASGMAELLSKGVRAQGGEPALDENQISEAWVDLGASFGASANMRPNSAWCSGPTCARDGMWTFGIIRKWTGAQGLMS